MARVAFTLRIDAEERAALENLSKVERRPVNQLLNEAVRNFLLRRRPKERSLEANLARLRAYRERDPQFRRARKAFVEAEVSVRSAQRREFPTPASAKRWQSLLMKNLTVPDARYVGAFRGEPDLEKIQVRVGVHYGADAVE